MVISCTQLFERKIKLLKHMFASYSLPHFRKNFLASLAARSRTTGSFDWPFLCSSAATRQHLSIWQTICSGPQMTARERDFGQLRPTNWSCAGHDCQRLETAPSASLHPVFGTVCQHASPQRIHCQPSRNI